MLITTDIRLFVLAGFTQEEIEKAFEFAEEFDATSVKVSKCGTIEFVFDRSEPYSNDFIVLPSVIDGGTIPTPFVPTVCTVSKDLRCEEDDTESY